MSQEIMHIAMNPVDILDMNKSCVNECCKCLELETDLLKKKDFIEKESMHIAVNSVDILDVNKSSVNECCKCLELETELFKNKDFIEKDVFDKLVKSYLTLEKHCISLELATQINQEIFQKENSGANQNAPTFNQLFKINELKAQSQEKDTVIRKLKEKIKSLSGKANTKCSTSASGSKPSIGVKCSIEAEAVATICYTQNCLLIRKRHNKTPYELLHDRKPNLSYLYVFGALWYPTNDGEDLGKLRPKADIGIFVGYHLCKESIHNLQQKDPNDY
ncbi:retrovirus-related pol polyprotein from transposon TNT 1-94 [Tanacetum coccineum]